MQRSGVVLRTPACPPDDAIDHAGEQEHSNYIMCHVLRVDVCATGAKVMVPSCCIVRNVVQHNCTTPRVILGRWCRWLAAVVPWWVRKALKAGSEEEGLRLCRAGAAHAAAGEHHVVLHDCVDAVFRQLSLLTVRACRQIHGAAHRPPWHASPDRRSPARSRSGPAAGCRASSIKRCVFSRVSVREQCLRSPCWRTTANK